MGNPVPGKNGNKYIPYSERKGNESVIYFTRDLSADGLRKMYERVNEHITGKVAVKLPDAHRISSSLRFSTHSL